MAIEITGRINIDTTSLDEAVNTVNQLKDNLEGVDSVSLDKFQNSISTAKNSADVLAGAIQGITGSLALLGVENEYINNLTQGAAGAIALGNGIDQAGRGLIELSKNTKVATVAQRAFNIVANANPYLLLATALIGATAAIIAVSRALDDSEKIQQALNEATERSIALRKEQISVEQELGRVVANNNKERLQNEITSINARLEVLDEEAKFIVANSKTLEDAGERINAVEDEKTKLRISRIALEKSLLTEEKNEQLSTFEQREKLLAAQGASERTLFESRVSTLQETIKLFGAESTEGIKAARELEVVRAKFATDEKLRAQQAAKDRQDLRDEEAVKLAAQQEVERQALIERNTQLAEEQANLLLSIEQLQNDFLDSRLTQEERELQAVRDKYFGIIEAAREAGIEVANLEANLQSELAAIEKEFSDERKVLNDEERADNLAAAQALEDAKRQLAGESLNAISGLLAAFTQGNEKAQRRTFNAQKALAIAETTISTYSAAQAAYASQLSIPSPDAPIRATIAAGAAIIQGLARVAIISKTKFNPAGGGGSPGGGSGGAVSNNPQAATPQFNLFGTGGSSVGGPGANDTRSQQEPQLIKAFVSETDLSTTNTRLALIRGGSEL